MSIVWLRHGETALNAAQVVQPADTPLSARGLAQAESVARRVAGLAPVALLSSDLPRALQTAQAVARATGLTLQTDPVLHERNFGALRGRPHAGLGFDLLDFTDAPPDGESLADFHARAALAWQRVVALRATLRGTLVVVTHGMLVHDVLERHAQLPDPAALPRRMGNTSVSIVDAEAPHRASLINCIAHLAGDPAPASGVA